MKKRTIRTCLALVFMIFVIRHLYYARAGYAETIACRVLYPLLVAQNALVAPFKKYSFYISSLQDCHARNERIMQENNQLKAQLIEALAATTFIDNCKEIIAFSKRYQVDSALLTHVIFSQVSNAGHFFLVDAGSCQGVQEDMVAVYKNCLVGRVVMVTPYWSKVILMTDLSSKIAGYSVVGKAKGIIEGTGQGDRLVMKFVHHLEKIALGSMVLSTGQGLVYPEGFALGKVRSCVLDGLYHVIDLEPACDFASLEYLYLLHKGAPI